MRACHAGWVALLVACAPEHAVLGRAYELTAPKDANTTTPLPLVFLAHGYGASGWAQDVVFPFSKQVDAMQFLYAQPNGTLDHLGRRFWNATDACCNYDDVPVDDVGYFRAMIDDVKSERAVGKVFVIGHSNGAFMALRLACEAGDVIDGVVAVAGSAWDDFRRCPDGRKIPILLVHGVQDDTIFYDGKKGSYPSAHVTGDRYARRAGCAGDWSAKEPLDFIGDATAETSDEVIAECEPTIELWSIDGASHVPPFDARWTRASIEWLEGHAR